MAGPSTSTSVWTTCSPSKRRMVSAWAARMRASCASTRSASGNGAAPTAAEVARHGVVVAQDAAGATLQVKADQVAGAVGRLLAALPVADLTVEDPPLEEVMKELFDRARQARGPEGDAAAG